VTQAGQEVIPPAQQGAQQVLGLGDLSALAGERIGVSRWHTISQDQVDLFADATGDRQWIHVDPERARSGPFGTTVAHGYLTLSLAPVLLWDILEVTGASQVINYGIGRARFPSPVPVGSRLRMALDLTAVEQVKTAVQTTFGLTFEVEGSEKPACVAEIVFRYYA